MRFGANQSGKRVTSLFQYGFRMYFCRHDDGGVSEDWRTKRGLGLATHAREALVRAAVLVLEQLSPLVRRDVDPHRDGTEAGAKWTREGQGELKRNDALDFRRFA